MSNLFILAAGGTGAKVAEALIHLCAAGLGPDQVHILLVDPDPSNGNRMRTLSTLKRFQAIREWPWAVRPTGGTEQRIELFKTQITLYTLTNEVGDPAGNKLKPLLTPFPAALEMVSLLLDDAELNLGMEIGFAGKPNLGSLVMDRYLSQNFQDSKSEARKFLDALRLACRNPQGRQPVAVIGSVFGGTGAALLPIARDNLRRAFDLPGEGGYNHGGDFKRILFGSVLQCPYFSPQAANHLPNNPLRFRLDTASALWFYDKTGFTEAGCIYYLLGSGNHTAREVKAAAGQGAQKNPAFFHETIAALALLDFAASKPRDPDADPILRHFGRNGDPENGLMNELPQAGGVTQGEILAKLSRLIQIAGFVLHKVQGSREFSKGLLQYAREATRVAWPNQLQKLFSQSKQKDLIESDGHWPLAVEYFARLLMWANTSFGQSSFHYSKDPTVFASLHNTMCQVEDGEIYMGVNHQPEEKDNLMAQICRLALAAHAREVNGSPSHGFALKHKVRADGGGLILGFPGPGSNEWVAAHFDQNDVNGRSNAAAIFNDYKV